MQDAHQLTLRIDHASPEAREWEERLKALLIEAAGQPWLRLMSSMAVDEDEPGPPISERAQRELGFRLVRVRPDEAY